MYSYSNSVFISEPNTFVFVFGFYFWTEYIRIRIRFLFLNRIYSYSYSVYISKPNSIRIQWKIENLYSFLCRWDWLYKAYFFLMMILTFLNPNIYLVRKKPLSIWTYLFDFLPVCFFLYHKFVYPRGCTVTLVTFFSVFICLLKWPFWQDA